MKTCNNIQINKHGLQLVFLKLLYKEKLINKETYYAARATLGPEYRKEWHICVGEIDVFPLWSRSDCEAGEDEPELGEIGLVWAELKN